MYLGSSCVGAQNGYGFILCDNSCGILDTRAIWKKQRWPQHCGHFERAWLPVSFSSLGQTSLKFVTHTAPSLVGVAQMRTELSVPSSAKEQTALPCGLSSCACVVYQGPKLFMSVGHIQRQQVRSLTIPVSTHTDTGNGMCLTCVLHGARYHELGSTTTPLTRSSQVERRCRQFRPSRTCREDDRLLWRKSQSLLCLTECRTVRMTCCRLPSLWRSRWMWARKCSRTQAWCIALRVFATNGRVD